MEIRAHPRHVEREPEGIGVREIRRDDETGRLRVYQGKVGVADGCGRLVGYLSGAVCAADAGGREGDVLLEPDEVGGDRGAEICGCVNYDGDVGFVERAGGAERGGEGGDCACGLEGMRNEGEELGRTFVGESFAGFNGDAAIGEAKCLVGLG